MHDGYGVPIANSDNYPGPGSREFRRREQKEQNRNYTQNFHEAAKRLLDAKNMISV